MSNKKSYRTYPAYRESGIEWLGQIPEHWETLRLKYTSTINDDVLPENTDIDFEINYIDISSIDPYEGVKKKETFKFGDAPSRARRKVKHGDVIVSTVRTYLRAIAPIIKPEDNLIVSTGFAVIRPKRLLKNSFTSYALRSSFFVDEVVSRSVGVSYPAINSSEIGCIYIVVPGLNEQEEIANYLDRETGRIDGLVAKKERQIELLKEKRAATISRAVTRGLNPEVKLKESGLEWLGQIPQHWKINKLRRISEIKGRIGWRGYTVSDLRDEDNGVLVIGATQIDKLGDLDLSNPTFLSYEKYEESPEIKLFGGEILIVKVGATIGKIGLFPHNLGKATINPNVMIVRKTTVHNRFLFYFFLSPLIQIEMETSKSAGAQDAINQDFVQSLNILMPPFSEQEEISDYLDRETGRIDGLIEKIKKSIALLKEKRSTLISAAVTGKIDVREQAV